MKKNYFLILAACLTLNVAYVLAIKKVAYVTLNKTTMDATATPVNNDPIIQVLRADANLELTVKVVASADVITDLASYDVIIVQESLGGGDAILKPAGSLALATLPKPFIYNKSYALKSTRALTTSTATGGKESNMALSITVQSTALTNDLFKACTIGTNNDITIFNALSTDLGLLGNATTSIKGLNYSTGNVISGSSTILAVPSILSTDAAPVAISFNDLPAGTSIDSEVTISRAIFVGMNFGAICANAGANITSDGLTIWRNAVYILAGLPVPTTKAVLPSATKSLDYNSNIVSEKYYTVNGVQVKTPTKGVFIKKTGFENGAVKTEKVVVFQTVVK